MNTQHEQCDASAPLTAAQPVDQVPASWQISMIWAQARQAVSASAPAFMTGLADADADADALARPAVIGVAGGIPWHVPEDFAHFKALTQGHPVIMGRRTWLSLPRRPLPGRTNIVLTADVDDLDASEGALTVATIQQAVAVAQAAPGADHIWVMGGASVYQQFMDAGLVDQLVVTDIDLSVQGDTFAPQICPHTWALASRGDWLESVNRVRYRISTYVARDRTVDANCVN